MKQHTALNKHTLIGLQNITSPIVLRFQFQYSVLKVLTNHLALHYTCLFYMS